MSKRALLVGAPLIPWTQLTGWKRWLSADGSQHLSFDPHLRHAGAPLLNGPAPRFPEVRFHCP